MRNPPLQPQILKLKSVTKATGLSKGTIYREMRAGKFPKPVKLSTRSVGWRWVDLEEWLDSRQVA